MKLVRLHPSAVSSERLANLKGGGYSEAEPRVEQVEMEQKKLKPIDWP